MIVLIKCHRKKVSCFLLLNRNTKSSVHVCKHYDTCIYPKYDLKNTSYHVDFKKSVDIHTTCTFTPPVHH